MRNRKRPMGPMNQTDKPNHELKVIDLKTGKLIDHKMLSVRHSKASEEFNRMKRLYGVDNVHLRCPSGHCHGSVKKLPEYTA